jgi:hypothetical protein
MSTRDVEQRAHARPECQVEGCHEWAVPWGQTLDVEPMQLKLHLCLRHEWEIREALKEAARR